MTALVAGLCGVLLVAGVLALIRGLRRTPAPAPTRTSETLAQTWARLTRRPPGPRGRRRDLLLLLALAAGIVTYLATGWAVLILLTPFVLIAVPALLADPHQAEADMLAALDRWVRGMAATLQTGQSITDALRTSGRGAPPLLASEVQLLVVRLDDRWPVRDALTAMADSLDTPDADSVLAALALAAQRGGTGAAATLVALTDSIQDRLKALRDIEAERAKPRVVVRQVTVISLVVLGIALLIGRDFFAPYRTGIGQLILVTLLLGYLGSLLAMRRVTAPPRRQRILQAGAR